MSLFSIGFVLLDDSDLLLSGISDIEFLETATSSVMIVGSAGENGVTSFDVSGAVPVEITRQGLTADSGTTALSDVLLLDAVSGNYALMLGRYDDNFGFSGIEDNGTLGIPVALSDSGSGFERGLVGDTIRIGSNAFSFVAQNGASGLSAYRLNSSDSFIQIGQYNDDESLFLGDVSTVSVGALHGRNFLFTASSIDIGVDIFEIRNGGSLVLRGNLDTSGEYGFSQITAIDSLQIGGRAFVFLASAGTDSLLSYRMSNGSVLSAMDDFTDTAQTRLANIQVLEAFQTDDRSFLLAGGGDDGLSLFEVTFRGDLVHLETLADDFSTTLSNISALSVVVTGETARVFVGSGSEHGITELSIDLSRSGIEIIGTGAAETLIGTDFDDVIWGEGQADVIDGGAGSDRIIDGLGRDFVTGGSGADTFVFMPDNRSDVIRDFEIGVDKIDLSYFDNTYYIGGIDLQSRANGAIIFMTPTDIIRINSIDGQRIEVDDFTQEDFIFG